MGGGGKIKFLHLYRKAVEERAAVTLQELLSLHPEKFNEAQKSLQKSLNCHSSFKRIYSELLKLLARSRSTSELPRQWHAVTLVFHMLCRKLGERAYQQGTDWIIQDRRAPWAVG